MTDVADYIDDVRRYDGDADIDIVAKIVKHLGIALQGKDSSLVSSSDQTELDRVRDNWGVKKLGLEPTAADERVAQVAGEMQGDRQKQRVTFYYLVAKRAGLLGSL